jgi:hypothetical protein
MSKTVLICARVFDGLNDTVGGPTDDQLLTAFIVGAWKHMLVHNVA